MVGEAGDEFTEGGEVADCDVELDAAVVGADAFASAVAGEFGADGEGPGFEFLDGVAVALDEVESGGVAVGEAVEGGAAVGAAGREGDGDAGDLGVDFEVGFAADGDAGAVGVPWEGWGAGVAVSVMRSLWHGGWRRGCASGGHQIETCAGCCGCGVLGQNLRALPY